MNKSEVIQSFLRKGYLISPDLLEVDISDNQSFLDMLNSKIVSKDKPLIVSKDLFLAVTNNGVVDINWLEFEKSKVLFEKKSINKMYDTFLNILNPNGEKIKDIKINGIPEIKRIEENKPIERGNVLSNVNVLKQFDLPSKKINMKDFVNYFRHRYEALKGILQGRQELSNLHSINRILNKQNGEEVATIGLVYDKQTSKNGNIILTLEDTTGFLKAIVTKSSPEAFKATGSICLDEVIGIVGKTNERFLFVTSVVFPDIMNNKQKKCDEDVCAAFISDIHVGSKMFLEKEFINFIEWLNGNSSDEKIKHIGPRVKYLFLIGDLVDGIGVYPGQENSLLLKNIKHQYNRLAELLGLINKDIKLIICPGNHDSIRAAEPQPQLDKDYAEALWNLPNVIMVSNPALINIHSKGEFEGYNILMYHGASFHYYVNNVPLLRENKSRDNPSHILKFLLQKRHLAPSHSSTTYVPIGNEDPLVIDKIPDIIVSGDMHRSDVAVYNGVIIINCSCWQSKTDFQEKTGNNPDFCKVPLFSLKEKKVFMVNFAE